MPSGVPHTSSCVLPHGDDGDAAVPPRLPAPEGADRSLDGCYGPYPSGSSEADARSSGGSPVMAGSTPVLQGCQSWQVAYRAARCRAASTESGPQRAQGVKPNCLASETGIGMVGRLASH